MNHSALLALFLSAGCSFLLDVENGIPPDFEPGVDGDADVDADGDSDIDADTDLPPVFAGDEYIPLSVSPNSTDELWPPYAFFSWQDNIEEGADPTEIAHYRFCYTTEDMSTIDNYEECPIEQIELVTNYTAVDDLLGNGFWKVQAILRDGTPSRFSEPEALTVNSAFAHWDFDNNLRNMLADEHHGTYAESLTPEYGVAGGTCFDGYEIGSAVGGVLCLPGDGYVTIPHSADLFVENLGLEIRFFMRSSEGTIIDGLNEALEPSAGYAFEIDAETQISWESNGALSFADTDTTILTGGVWLHVFLTHRDGLQMLYIDNEEPIEAYESGVVLDSGLDMIIGARHMNPSGEYTSHMFGAIDFITLMEIEPTFNPATEISSWVNRLCAVQYLTGNELSESCLAE